MGTNETILTLPLLPMKNTALFPHLLMPLSVGRPRSVAAVEAALASESKEIVIVSQRDSSVEDPDQHDLYTYGTRAVIKRNQKNGDLIEIVVLGLERVMVLKLEQDEPGAEPRKYIAARVQRSPVLPEDTPEVEALQRAVAESAQRMFELNQAQVPFNMEQMIASSEEDPIRLVYLLSSVLHLDLEKEQTLLEAQSCADAYRLLHSYLSHELQVLEIRQNISSKASNEMSKEQRQYYLRQQMKAIQDELGDKSESAEVDQLREKIAKAELPEEVRKEAERELGRLERVPTASPEHNVIRTYLEYVAELPWKTATADNLNISHARMILDEDHFNMKEVKERILEHLGVLKMNAKAKAPILCLVGPPGVGKTSLGKSIARSLERKFERFSLGGMHDEAELRGHRRTYIGAMPGRLIQALRRAGSNNPVILLDEIDKLGRDFRGDPASALLEVLDPEQNATFRDNYLDMNFDLSKVLFITTANSLDTIPRPLLDRMEVLRLSGYTEEEKVEIAKRYLIPKQLNEAGLKPEQVEVTDEALGAVIGRYTREAGLRRLERAVAKLMRKATLHYAEDRPAPFVIKPETLADLLGPEPFSPELARKKSGAGVVAGLAWTEAGGDVLYIEAIMLPDGKGLTITGQLGEVMQESAKAAQSYLWSHAAQLGIDAKLFSNAGVHLHVPAGAVPKDGPSAGVTMATALASLYTGQPARMDTAMTGEITLAGLVLPIGGVKEKVLAARRAGIKRVVLPKGNQKDIRDVPEAARAEMEFIFAEHVGEVIEAVIPALKEQVAALA
jgi:ATP-dependent Lon protease